MVQVNDSYSTANKTIVLSSKPSCEEQLMAWAEHIVALIGAELKEVEQAADLFCWRLAIERQHWLLFYSATCDAAWLEPLEATSDRLLKRLNEQGLVR